MSVFADKTQSGNDQDELSKFDSFLQTELPPLVHSELEKALCPQSAVLKEHLDSLLPEIIRDCQARLYRKYGKLNASAEQPQESSNVGDSNLALANLAAYKPVDPFFEFTMQPEMFGGSTLSPMDHTNPHPHYSDSGFGTCGVTASKEDLDTWLARLEDEGEVDLETAEWRGEIN